ncbi:hypothetical protein COJ46_01880 [Bacillus sp. AFS077874]|uniref:DUF4132 domain-containing protein n=1 Tax=unclassified Bacillus (in: firmicutes) TaxID=185979 RepID=UPI000BEE0922|nr:MULTISPECIES: DUF4132 domain-containing protein [unclassified Bacillus (in: firmicutes)]PEC48591.1 hypothetical protein CON00_13450 [Bacillus sp. AFS096315]PFM82585.1 hypothetical protein COJ46_01880 [Bacillus sp. AFS077874]
MNQYKEYYQSLEEKLHLLDGDHLKIARLMINGAKSSSYYNHDYVKPIRKLLSANPNLTKNEYFEPIRFIIKSLLGEQELNKFDYILAHVIDFPHSESYYRRPFRTKDMAVHTKKVIEKSFELVRWNQHDVNLKTLLTTPSELSEDYDYHSILSDLIAYELDHENEEIKNSLKEIIYGENNTALLSRWMIKGMFKSHKQESYEDLGKLLLAAGLQEGLRQNIVETMDEGTIDGMKFLLQIIIENNLTRFSSIVRALAVWTGVEFESNNKRIVNQVITYISLALNNENIQNDWTSQNNVDKLYISLWAKGVYEEADLINEISLILTNGLHYQKVVAHYLIGQLENKPLIYSLLTNHFEQTDIELQAWTIKNYPYRCSTRYNFLSGNENKFLYYKEPLLQDKHVRTKQFNYFCNLVEHGPKANKVLNSSAFKQMEITYSPDTIIQILIYLTAYDLDHNWIAQLMKYKKYMTAETRSQFLDYFIVNIDDPTQKEYLFNALSDRSVLIREEAIAKIKKITSLNDSDIPRIEALLTLKTPLVRQEAIHLLLKLKDKQLKESLKRLLSSKKAQQRLGALDIVNQTKEHNVHKSNFDQYKELLHLISNPTENERLQIDKLTKQEWNEKNGFGLYDPIKIRPVRKLEIEKSYQQKEWFTLNKATILSFLNGLTELIHENKDYEFEIEYWDGQKESVLLGSHIEMIRHYKSDDLKMIDQLPLPDVWKNYLISSGLRTNQIIELWFYLNGHDLVNYYDHTFSTWDYKYRNYDLTDEENLTPLNSRQKDLLSSFFPISSLKKVGKTIVELNYEQQIRSIIEAYFNDLPKEDKFHYLLNQLKSFSILIADGSNWLKIYDYLSESLIEWLEESIYDDESFIEYYEYKNYLYHYCKKRLFKHSPEDLIRAYTLNVIDKNELLKEILSDPKRTKFFREIYVENSELVKKYPEITKIAQKILDRVLEIELKRGDLATSVSNFAGGIDYFEGTSYFVQILERLGDEGFVRGYFYASGEEISKKESFSSLLKACYPNEHDHVEILFNLLNAKEISEKRLLEAAMYAPQWLDLVSDYLNWCGLKSAAWYFHAHINEDFEDKKAAIVAHYSPIEPIQFNDGAFDINWFTEAYKELGSERFEILYDCAKYISGGANHRRSQLFADVVLGKLNLENLKTSVVDKRNKEHLLCYSLVPLDNSTTKDLVIRYEFIQQFLKESKQYGAQRRASETKIVEIALGNLARNAGYSDTIRMTWDLESKKAEEYITYFEPKKIDELMIRLELNEKGAVNFIIDKNDKALKSIPAKYKKHEYILKLTEVKKEIKDQLRRAKTELEKSMVSETIFTVKELENLTKNMIVKQLMSKLLFVNENKIGFFEDNKLISPNGNEYQLSDSDFLKIAHPTHLYKSGMWSECQKFIFENKIVQPFKQVFRELYLPTIDELANGKISRRYEGHQVQPRKTGSLLKSRLWTASYEEGLQKVFYKENIIVKIYAAADWFSPSDVEAPTLETIEFINRKTYENISIEDIPTIIFSEVMRDVDLVVSIAHVGGVDPEASLSTIEMRKAIIHESLRLMKISNVDFSQNHAKIDGKLGEYNVHLGSGNTYKNAKGALYIIPVHSQHRGKIFLPFIDEDPKTAEILSKIVLLAQDQKIKDPNILMQLN